MRARRHTRTYHKRRIFMLCYMTWSRAAWGFTSTACTLSTAARYGLYTLTSSGSSRSVISRQHEHTKCRCRFRNPTALSASSIEEGTEVQQIDHKEQDVIRGDINVTSIEVMDALKDLNDISNGYSKFSKKEAKAAVKKIWRRRHARSIDEGIRRTGQNSPQDGLKQILYDTNSSKNKRPRDRGYAARTLAGLIVALAEEAHGLEVEVDSRGDTPLWDKHVDTVTVNFSRLGFKPLRMEGLNDALNEFDMILSDEEKHDVAQSLLADAMPTAEKTFDKIDVDRSGALDQSELTTALSMAMFGRASIPKTMLATLAARLVALYDENGDQVLDKEEYRSMVQDMAALRRVQLVRKIRKSRQKGLRALWSKIVQMLRFNNKKLSSPTASSELDLIEFESDNTDIVASKPLETTNTTSQGQVQSIEKGIGSITLSNLKLDLRQIVFGTIPGVKYVTPGGPLILEPFTMTIKGQFNPDDMMDSFLLDTGLRRLVARVLQRRVRSVRDLYDGAVFYGRTWNMACETAPVVEVPQLTNVEFDEQDRAVITGIARIRASPDAPTIENSFKLRTRIGTRKNGQVIRLQDPEIAILLNCPKAWERNIVSVLKKLNLPIPQRPKPVVIFVPLLQPRVVTDKDGFDLGEDNCIKSIDTKDGALRIEMSAVLRPGRFLGSHYIAFSLPQRTFIVTKDRMKNAIRQARRNAVLAKQQASIDGLDGADGTLDTSLNKKYSFVDVHETNDSSGIDEEDDSNNTNFFAKFFQGYKAATKTERDWIRNESLKSAVSEWFGRQDVRSTDGEVEEIVVARLD